MSYRILQNWPPGWIWELFWWAVLHFGCRWNSQRPGLPHQKWCWLQVFRSCQCLRDIGFVEYLDQELTSYISSRPSRRIRCFYRQNIDQAILDYCSGIMWSVMWMVLFLACTVVMHTCCQTERRWQCVACRLCHFFAWNVNGVLLLIDVENN